MNNLEEFEIGLVDHLSRLFKGKPITIYMDENNVQLQPEGFIRTFVGFCESVTPFGITLLHVKENGKDKRTFHFLDKIGTIEECDDDDILAKKEEPTTPDSEHTQ